MPNHEHNHDRADSALGRATESLRPKGSRIDERPEPLLMEAAAAGRPDVLGADGLAAVQRVAGNAAVGAALAEDAPGVTDVTSRPGAPLPDATRAEMEARLGADFGDVRVHTDGEAHASAAAVNAHAYTVGSNVVFQRGMFDMNSSNGKTMLAHELTHVIQQRSGPVDGTDRGDGIAISDPSDRFEREAAANAERVMSTPLAGTALPPALPTAAPPAPGPASAGPAVQRVEDAEGPEDETLQGAFVQREATVPDDLDEAQA